MTEKKRTERRKVTRIFQIPLSEEKKALLAKESAKLNDTINHEEDDFKNLKKEIGDKIKVKKQELNEKLSALNVGHENKSMDAHEIKDFENNEIRWECIKTKDVLDCAKMEADEKQTNMTVEEV